MDRELYSIEQARALLGGIVRNTLYDLLRSGKLASVPIGRVRSVADVIERMSEAPDVGGVCLTEGDLPPEFFDLRSGLAGELFQKLVNHRIRTAIVLADPGKYGERIRELVREHRTHPVIRFFPTAEAAQAWIASAASPGGA